MISLGFFVSTIVSSQIAANSTAYTFILVTIIFELVFSQPDFNNRFFFNDADVDNFTINFTKAIFNLFPSFPISVCFGCLVKKAATHVDKQAFAWVEGEKYTWFDFGQEYHGKLMDGVTYSTPSPLESMRIIFIDMCIFLVLTWYFDHILSHNRGVADPSYFFLTQKYWYQVFGWKTPEQQAAEAANKEAAERRRRRGKKSKSAGKKFLLISKICYRGSPC
jgi:hypothetical protein